MISKENQPSYGTLLQNQRAILGERSVQNLSNSPQNIQSLDSSRYTQRLSATSSSFQKLEPSNIDSLESQDVAFLRKAFYVTSKKGLPMSILQAKAPYAAKVIIRIRPGVNKETGAASIFRINDSKLLVRQQQSDSISQSVKPQQTTNEDKTNQIYNFDYVSGPETNQERFFATVGRPMIENCLAGYNSSIFAYGQTGSGKTYTMLGELPIDINQYNTQSGLIPRMFNYLFHRITQIEEKLKDSRQAQFRLKCTYLQIYQDNITDLLGTNDKKIVIRQEGTGGQVQVEGLQETEIQNVDDVIDLLKRGSANRKLAETNMNTESSRSHCIVTCNLEIQIKEGGIVNIRKSQLHLVDLAGSERYNNIEDNDKQRSKELNYINRSLSTLGLVILKLSTNQSHIPYRDSKLTFLLQNSLGGNSRTVFIANVSPACNNILETQSTLGFAQRAKVVKNKAHINEINQYDQLDDRREKESLQREIQNYLEQLSKFIPTNKQKYYQSPTKQLKYIFAYNEKLNQRNENLQQQLLQTQREKRELEFQVNQQQSIIDLMEQKYEQQQDELSALQNLHDYNLQQETNLDDNIKANLDFSTPQVQSKTQLQRPRKTSFQTPPSDFDNFSFNVSDPSTINEKLYGGHSRNISNLTEFQSPQDQISPRTFEAGIKKLPSRKENSREQQNEIIQEQQEEIQSLRQINKDLINRQSFEKFAQLNEEQERILNKQLHKAWQEIESLQSSNDKMQMAINNSGDLENQSEQQLALKLVLDLRNYLQQQKNGQQSNKSNTSYNNYPKSFSPMQPVDIKSLEELRQQIIDCFTQKRSQEQNNNTLVLRNNQLQNQVTYVRNLQSQQYAILINLREMLSQAQNENQSKSDPHVSSLYNGIDLTNISQEIESLGKLMRSAFQEEVQMYSNLQSPMNSDSSLQYPQQFQRNLVRQAQQSHEISPQENQFVLKSTSGERTYTVPNLSLSNQDFKSNIPPASGSNLANSQRMIKYTSPKLHISIPSFNPNPSPHQTRYPPVTHSEQSPYYSDAVKSFDNEDQLCGELDQLHQQIQMLQQSNQAMQLDNQMLSRQKEILISQLQDNEKFGDENRNTLNRDIDSPANILGLKQKINSLEQIVENMETSKCELEMILQNKIVRLDTVQDSLEAMQRERLEVNKTLQAFKGKLQDWIHKQVGHQSKRSNDIEVEVERDSQYSGQLAQKQLEQINSNNSLYKNLIGPLLISKNNLTSDSVTSEKYGNINTVSEMNKLLQILFSELEQLHEQGFRTQQPFQIDSYVENAFRSKPTNTQNTISPLHNDQNLDQNQSNASQQLQSQFKQILSKFLVLVKTFFCAEDVEKIDMIDELLTLLEVLTDHLLGFKGTQEQTSPSLKQDIKNMSPEQKSPQMDRSLMIKRKQSHKRPQLLESAEILSDEEEKDLLDIEGNNQNAKQDNEHINRHLKEQGIILSQSGVKKHDLQCQIQELKQERNYLQRMYQGSKSQLIQMSAEVDSLRNKVDKGNGMIKQLQKDLKDSQLISHEQLLNTLADQGADIENKNSEIQELNKAIAHVQGDLNNHKLEAQTMEYQISSLETTNRHLQKSNLIMEQQVQRFELERVDLNKLLLNKQGINESLEIQLGTQKSIVEKLLQDSQLAENQKTAIRSLKQQVSSLKENLKEIKHAYNQSWIQQFQALYVQALSYVKGNPQDFAFTSQQPQLQGIRTISIDGKEQNNSIQVKHRFQQSNQCTPLIIIDLWNQMASTILNVFKFSRDSYLYSSKSLFTEFNQPKIQQLLKVLESNKLVQNIQIANKQGAQLQVIQESGLKSKIITCNGYQYDSQLEDDENMKNINSAFSTKLSFPPLSGSQTYNKSLLSQSINPNDESIFMLSKLSQQPTDRLYTQESHQPVNSNTDREFQVVQNKQSRNRETQNEPKFGQMSDYIKLGSMNMLTSQQWQEKLQNLSQLEAILKKLSWKQELFLKLSDRICWFVDKMECKLKDCVEKHVYNNNVEDLQNDLILQTQQSDEEIAIDLQLLDGFTEHHQLNQAYEQAQRSQLLANIIIKEFENLQTPLRRNKKYLSPNFQINQSSVQTSQMTGDNDLDFPQSSNMPNLPNNYQVQSIQSSALPNPNDNQNHRGKQKTGRYIQGVSSSGINLGSPAGSLDPSPMYQDNKPKFQPNQSIRQSSTRDGAATQDIQQPANLYHNQGECTSYTSSNQEQDTSAYNQDTSTLKSYSIQECTQSIEKARSSNNSNTPAISDGQILVKNDNPSNPSINRMKDILIPQIQHVSSIGQSNSKNEPRESQGVTPFQQAQNEFRNNFRNNFQQSLRLRDLEKQMSQKEVYSYQELSPEFKNYCISFRCMPNKPNQQQNQILQCQQNIGNLDTQLPLQKSQSFSLQSQHTPRFHLAQKQNSEQNLRGDQTQQLQNPKFEAHSVAGNSEDMFDQQNMKLQNGFQSARLPSKQQTEQTQQLQTKKNNNRKLLSFLQRNFSGGSKKKQYSEA